MIRLIALTLMILCFGIFTDSLTAEDKVGTIRGVVSEATPERNPIPGVTVSIVGTDGVEYTAQTNDKGEYRRTGLPAGRYTLSYSKDSYGDRVGRPRHLVAGGEIFDRILMRKKDTIVTFFMKNPLGWTLFLGAAVVMTVVFILLFLHVCKRGI